MRFVPRYRSRYIVIGDFFLHNLCLDGMQYLLDNVVFPSGVDFLKNIASLL